MRNAFDVVDHGIDMPQGVHKVLHQAGGQGRDIEHHILILLHQHFVVQDLIGDLFRLHAQVFQPPDGF
jgi:hypothetical protein